MVNITLQNFLIYQKEVAFSYTLTFIFSCKQLFRHLTKVYFYIAGVLLLFVPKGVKENFQKLYSITFYVNTLASFNFFTFLVNVRVS